MKDRQHDSSKVVTKNRRIGKKRLKNQTVGFSKQKLEELARANLRITRLRKSESRISKTEMIFREDILSKMTYSHLNSKRFIKSNLIRFSPSGKGEGAHRPLFLETDLKNSSL